MFFSDFQQVLAETDMNDCHQRCEQFFQWPSYQFSVFWSEKHPMNKFSTTITNPTTCCKRMPPLVKPIEVEFLNPQSYTFKNNDLTKIIWSKLQFNFLTKFRANFIFSFVSRSTRTGSQKATSTIPQFGKN